MTLTPSSLFFILRPLETTFFDHMRCCNGGMNVEERGRFLCVLCFLTMTCFTCPVLSFFTDYPCVGRKAPRIVLLSVPDNVYVLSIDAVCEVLYVMLLYLFREHSSSLPNKNDFFVVWLRNR